MRLNAQAWSALPEQVEHGNYDRDALGIGVVHIGPGAFHRAHQAYYTDLALAHGGDWGISAISMNSRGVADALNPQDGLYTLAIQDVQSSYRVVGSVKEVLHLPSERQLVMERLCAKTTKVVTLTVTEKGYMLNQQGELDATHADISADVAQPKQATTVIGLLAYVVHQRAALGMPALTIISCDNVSDNGDKLQRALMKFAELSDLPDLSNLIQQQRFPNTMVDCITPASDAELAQQVEKNTGIQDAWPIKREAFSQWVIEDLDEMVLPAWRDVGVTFTKDIHAYENAKLRILNLAHSALAYLGPLYACETVYQAISRHELREFVDALLDQEVIPGLVESAGETLDHVRYKSATITRFENPHIKHLLSQIAHDGSQKLAIRAVPVLRENLEQGRPIQHLCQLLMAWANYVFRCANESDAKLVDPMSDDLLACVSAQSFSLDAIETLFETSGLLSRRDLQNNTLRKGLQFAFSELTELT